MIRKILFSLSLCLSLPTYAEGPYDSAAMDKARKALFKAAGGQKLSLIEAERLEFKTAEEELVWDIQGWYGGDLHKLWIKTEGDYSFPNDQFGEAEIQALYSRATTAFFDMQVGLRHDINPNPSRTYAVVGLQGLAPYWLEVDAAAFISNKGDIFARLEVEYEILLTQRLILQPRTELNFALQNVEELQTGAGLSSSDIGLRLRYEVKRQFAPYIGLSWRQAYGNTADYLRTDGNNSSDISFLAGVRLWY